MAERISNKFGEEGLVVLTINDDRNTEKVKKAIAKVDTSLPVLHDRGSETVDAYRAFALPTLFLIDRQQQIYTVWFGSVKEREGEIEEHIRFVLKPDVVPAAETSPPASAEEQKTK